MTALLEVRELRTQLQSRHGPVTAVDGVSFDVHEGDALGIVGESGSGKTMTAMSLVRMLPRGAASSGSVRLAGEDLLAKSEAQMQKVRGREIGVILQDPMSSLNPVFTIGEQLVDAIRAHRPVQRAQALQESAGLLERVRIPAAAERVRDYPHQLSGGMRQRAVGAMAISSPPRLLIADEPTTALDVTVQAQYLQLMRDLQRELGLALILITHDFGVVAAVCNRVAVMYAGRIVEQGPVERLFDAPRHPYTRALLAARRTQGLQRKARLPSLAGQPPALWAMPRGCRFADRCESASARCREQYPPAALHAADHQSACWLEVA